ncbi:class IIb bacteriocin, lactobin A/cerein 7B family [Cellulosilyticum sp. ST5]|uniref:class IIb bacteriocin, lactobin A/cerein 7B family n=1 Tax=Cellulosilyticum sp. ST5 TaxID=3055805 RepID=UPI003977C8C4
MFKELSSSELHEVEGGAVPLLVVVIAKKAVVTAVKATVGFIVAAGVAKGCSEEHDNK